MARQTPENFKRPARVTKQAEVVQEKKTARAVMKQIPAHYIESIRDNANLSACCRDTNNLEFHTEKTDPDLKSANKGVFTCTSCGSKHIRMAQGGGSFGG